MPFTRSSLHGFLRDHPQGISMLIQPIDYFLVVWFCLAAASTVYVGVDQYRNNPEPLVMKWGSSSSRSIWGRSDCCSTCLPTRSHVRRT